MVDFVTKLAAFTEEDSGHMQLGNLVIIFDIYIFELKFFDMNKILILK